MDILDRMDHIRTFGKAVTGEDGRLRRWHRKMGRLNEPYTVTIVSDLDRREALFVFASDRDVSKTRWVLVEERGKCWMRYPVAKGADEYEVMDCIGKYGPNKYVQATQDILHQLSTEGASAPEQGDAGMLTDANITGIMPQ